MQENYEIFKDLIQLFVLEILKKSSENGQSTGLFRAFFLFFPSPTLNLKKNSRKSTNKKIWPYH